MIDADPEPSAAGATIGLRIDSDRLVSRLMALGEIGAIEGTTGCARLALTDEDRAGRDLVRSWMDDLGLDISTDGVGNVVGTMPGFDPALAPVMTGSHIDTVGTGGRYDGNLGVLAGLEVIETVSPAGRSTGAPARRGLVHRRGGRAFPSRHARQLGLRRRHAVGGGAPDHRP